jgi:hypothetical protein
VFPLLIHEVLPSYQNMVAVLSLASDFRSCTTRRDIRCDRGSVHQNYFSQTNDFGFRPTSPSIPFRVKDLTTYVNEECSLVIYGFIILNLPCGVPKLRGTLLTLRTLLEPTIRPTAMSCSWENLRPFGEMTCGCFKPAPPNPTE